MEYGGRDCSKRLLSSPEMNHSRGSADKPMITKRERHWIDCHLKALELCPPVASLGQSISPSMDSDWPCSRLFLGLNSANFLASNPGGAIGSESRAHFQKGIGLLLVEIKVGSSTNHPHTYGVDRFQKSRIGYLWLSGALWNSPYFSPAYYKIFAGDKVTVPRIVIILIPLPVLLVARSWCTQQTPLGTSVLPTRFLELYFAPAPNPRLANAVQISHWFSPPVRAVSASRMASRAWTKLGLHGCLFVISGVNITGEAFLRTYNAIPSMTSFMARYLPSVGTPSRRVGFGASFLPCLSIKFHNTSYSMDAQTVPMACTAFSELTLVYVRGLVLSEVEYGYWRIPPARLEAHSPMV